METLIKEKVNFATSLRFFFLCYLFVNCDLGISLSYSFEGTWPESHPLEFELVYDAARGEEVMLLPSTADNPLAIGITGAINFKGEEIPARAMGDKATVLL